MAEPLTLVVNPGSASRKYALYRAGRYQAGLHFEYSGGAIVCTLDTPENHRVLPVQLADIRNAAHNIPPLLQDNNLLKKNESITHIGLRIVAPSSFFLRDHIMTNEATDRLRALLPLAPLHITATLNELEAVRNYFPNAKVVGVSDSAFHATKPDYAWNYGINLHDADTHEIKRFGYHGISAASAMRTLTSQATHSKVIIAHIGSGISVTAVRDDKSVDTTMGYSPLEGAIMSTRSGSIDITAARVLQSALTLDDTQLDKYLNEQSGLLGLGGSADVRELLAREAAGDHTAHLALDTYIYVLRKLIGQMGAALGGVDALVLTGTIGERSASIRTRLLQSFDYLGLSLDNDANQQCLMPTRLTKISLGHSLKPIYVIPATEADEIARRTVLL